MGVVYPYARHSAPAVALPRPTTSTHRSSLRDALWKYNEAELEISL